MRQVLLLHALVTDGRLAAVRQMAHSLKGEADMCLAHDLSQAAAQATHTHTYPLPSRRQQPPNPASLADACAAAARPRQQGGCCVATASDRK